jgi:hypothetical protein
MEISKLQLEQLASHIVSNLNCHCGCTLEESSNEPCACGWTNVEEMFRDDFEVELKMYPESLHEWYVENYGIEPKKEKK